MFAHWLDPPTSHRYTSYQPPPPCHLYCHLIFFSLHSVFPLLIITNLLIDNMTMTMCNHAFELQSHNSLLGLQCKHIILVVCKNGSVQKWKSWKLCISWIRFSYLMTYLPLQPTDFHFFNPNNTSQIGVLKSYENFEFGSSKSNWSWVFELMV
jgi:hypothetical protein